MNHAEVHTHMADYLEGDLDLTKRALLDAHLDACSACSREFAEMRGTISLLRALPDPEPSPFLVAHVMRRVREEEGGFRLGDRLREWFAALASPQFALPAAALAIGLLMANVRIDSSGIAWHRGSEEIASVAPRPDQGTSTPVELLGRDESSRRRARPGQPAHLAEFVSQPVVAGVPSPTIDLPDADRNAGRNLAFDDPRFFAPPVVRGPRSMQSFDASSAFGAYAMNVGNGPAPVAPYRPQSTSGSAFRSRNQLSLQPVDPRLASLLEWPAQFSAEFAQLSVVEQEACLRDLAEQAIELGQDGEVLRQLRSANDVRARELATAFSAELSRIAPNRRMATAVRMDEGSSSGR